MKLKKPILINKNAVALISIYTRSDDLELIAFWDNFPIIETTENAAKEFIKQLDDRYSIRFLEALRDEIDRVIESEAKA